MPYIYIYIPMYAYLINVEMRNYMGNLMYIMTTIISKKFAPKIKLEMI